MFAAAGANAFRQNSPDARIELVDGGHFLLESHLSLVADTIKDWLANRG